MKNKLLFNSLTKNQIENFLAKPSHALLVVGPRGAGKSTIAHMVSAKILGIETDKLTSQAFFLKITKPETKQNIAIETIRDVIKFLNLRVLSAEAVNRVVLIEDAELMTAEAQNALLKSLEEPPAGTVFILTAHGEQNLLPTIASRSTKLAVRPVSLKQALSYFEDSTPAEIESAWRLSQGYAGLLASLISDESHELKSAVNLAKKFIGQNTYERLLALDSFSASKAEFGNFLTGLSKILQALYKNSANPSQTKRLISSMDLVLQCRRDLELNVSSRLIALRLALNLSV